MMEEPTCPATPPLSKCPDTPPRAGSSKSSPSKWNTSSDSKEKSSSPNRPSSPENCAICLGPLANKSFTNSCCHQFCFVCLLEWSKVKAECPLCKVAFDSIIHNVRSQDDYDQYHVVRQPPQRAPADSSVVLYARTQHQYRAFSEWMALRGINARNQSFNFHTVDGVNAFFLHDAIPHGPPTRAAPRGNPNGTSAFRRSIYERDLWARIQPDITGRYRECSPDFYAQNPAQVHRLMPFINRELNVLLDNGSRTMYVMDKILELLPQFHIQSSEFRSRVARLIGNRHAPHFCHELRAFAVSVYDLIGYDRNVQYHENGGAGYSIEIEDDPSDSHVDSDDDDVRIIEPSNERTSTTRNPSASVSASASASVGASTSSSSSSGISLLSSHGNSSVVTVPSDSDSDIAEDVQIVGYVKPRHERTPELITLSSPEHPQSSASRAFSPPHSPNDLICINLGNTSTADVRWQENETSSDEEPLTIIPQHQNRSRKNVNFLEPISSSESFQSSNSDSEKKKKHRHSKRGNKSSKKRHLKTKHHKIRNQYESGGEDDSQPSTSKGHFKQSRRKDCYSVRRLSSKLASSSRNIYTDSDTDSDIPPRTFIRSAIVPKKNNNHLSSDPEDEEKPSALSNNPKLRNVINMTRVLADDSQDKWKVNERSSSPENQRTHSSRNHEKYVSNNLSPNQRQHSPSRRERYDTEVSRRKRKKHSRRSKSSSSSQSRKHERKSRDRSRSSESYSKRPKKKRSLSNSDSDELNFKSPLKRSTAPLHYSEDSDL
ncbi:E3 ubiquitin-protein ligase Topors [Frankliniella fusca]|uniref:E3 ubiquitin-protein ligase Topors n=1 Tax=Frankliniella fusca TaxID=407009 RepID=A0AAE1H222_9NEOP|nr:E3 ubiquitin-protein ligase Topors [Frankliniella fusca]